MEVMKRLDSGRAITEIAAEFGVGRTQISIIL